MDDNNTVVREDNANSASWYGVDAQIDALKRLARTRVGGRECAMPCSEFADIVERLDSARKRERNRQYEPKCDWSIKDALALANTLANHGLRDGNADAASSCIYSLCRILSSPGNAAAMREALEWLQGFGYVVDGEFRFPNTNMVKQRVDAALSTPPRNCDRYDCAEAAWNAYVEQNGAASDRSWKALILFAKWLFAEANEKGHGDGSK